MNGFGVFASDDCSDCSDIFLYWFFFIPDNFVIGIVFVVRICVCLIVRKIIQTI